MGHWTKKHDTTGASQLSTNIALWSMVLVWVLISSAACRADFPASLLHADGAPDAALDADSLLDAALDAAQLRDSSIDTNHARDVAVDAIEPHDSSIDAAFLDPAMLDSALQDGTTPDAGSICGNGVKERGEACDDGNQTSGDGYSATCEIECSNGSTTDCNPQGQTITPSSAFVDQEPPTGYIQCAGFQNTSDNDVGPHWDGNCIGALHHLRIRYWDTWGRAL